MDGRILQDEILLARVLLKQAGESVYHQCRDLIDTYQEHALNLVAAIMYLQRADLLQSHINELLQAPEQAFQVAIQMVNFKRAQSHVEDACERHVKMLSLHNNMPDMSRIHKFTAADDYCYINDAMKKYPFLAEYNQEIHSNLKFARVLVRGLVLLRNRNLSQMIPAILANPRDSYQLANGFIKLFDANLHEKKNIDSLIECSRLATIAADIIIQLRWMDLADYVDLLMAHSEHMYAMLYVLVNFHDKKYLALTLNNELNKTEVIKFIHYAYQTICEHDSLHFMALSSPADKAKVIVTATKKRFQRKALKTNVATFYLHALRGNDESNEPSRQLKK